METILKFERVVLTKELNEKFCKVGEVYEVAKVLDDSFLLRDAGTRVAIGVVKFSDFERCFEKEEERKGWTDWIQFTGYNNQNDCFYKTNRKKVKVKFETDKVRAESCCCKEDEFNLAFGLRLAYLRGLNKLLTRQKNELESSLKKVDVELADNNNIIEKMIASLN